MVPHWKGSERIIPFLEERKRGALTCENIFPLLVALRTATVELTKLMFSDTHIRILGSQAHPINNKNVWAFRTERQTQTMHKMLM